MTLLFQTQNPKKKKSHISLSLSVCVCMSIYFLSSILIYDSFFSDLWLFLLFWSMILSLSWCVCMYVYLFPFFFFDLCFFLFWFMIFSFFWSMILWNLNGSNPIGYDCCFKFKCRFLVWNPVDLAFIFWSFLFGYWENEEEGSLFLVWNLV